MHIKIQRRTSRGLWSIYKKVLGVTPNYAEAYNNMGNAFRDQEGSEEAIKAYNKAIHIKKAALE